MRQLNLDSALAQRLRPTDPASRSLCFGQKIILHRQLANLSVQPLELLFLMLGSRCIRSEHSLRSLNQPSLPILDLVRMQIRSASSARVFSPFRAARATLALKADEWLRRLLRVSFCSFS